jgi:hypothetical protein
LRKSDPAIAAEIGVDHKTVGRARKQNGDRSLAYQAQRKDGKQKNMQKGNPTKKKLPGTDREAGSHLIRRQLIN